MSKCQTMNSKVNKYLPICWSAKIDTKENRCDHSRLWVITSMVSWHWRKNILDWELIKWQCNEIFFDIYNVFLAELWQSQV